MFKNIFRNGQIFSGHLNKFIASEKKNLEVSLKIHIQKKKNKEQNKTKKQKNLQHKRNLQSIIVHYVSHVDVLALETFHSYSGPSTTAPQPPLLLLGINAFLQDVPY